jgi:hypothetical protein
MALLLLHAAQAAQLARPSKSLFSSVSPGDLIIELALSLA